MGTALGHEAHIIVDSFTPQHSKVKLARCEFAKDVTEMAIDVTIQMGVMSVNAGQFTGALGAMATRAERLMLEAKRKNDYKKAIRAAQQLNLARNSMYYTQWAVGTARKGYKTGQKVSDAHYADKGSKLPEREVPRLEFPLIKGHGMCGNLFNVHEDNASAQVDQLILFIHEQLHALRYTVEQVFNSLFIKEQEDLGDVALEDIMGLEKWEGVPMRSYEGIEKYVF